MSPENIQQNWTVKEFVRNNRDKYFLGRGNKIFRNTESCDDKVHSNWHPSILLTSKWHETSKKSGASSWHLLTLFRSTELQTNSEIYIEVDPHLNFDPVLGHLASESFSVLISEIVRIHC